MSSGYGGDHIELKSLSINDHYYSHICGCSTALVLNGHFLLFCLFLVFKNLHFKVEILKKFLSSLSVHEEKLYDVYQV